MGKNIGKNLSKSLSGNYSQNFLDRAKRCETDAFKTDSKRAIQNTAIATGNLIENKSANEIKKKKKSLQQNNLETVTNQNDKEIPKKIPKERYIFQKKNRKLLII